MGLTGRSDSERRRERVTLFVELKSYRSIVFEAVLKDRIVFLAAANVVDRNFGAGVGKRARALSQDLEMASERSRRLNE